MRLLLSSASCQAFNMHANFLPPSCFPPATGLVCSNAVTGENSSYAPQSSVALVTSACLTHHSVSDSALLRPRVPFKLAAFNVRTLMRIGQQASLARTLETLAIDVCCLSETRIQDLSALIRFTSPSNPKATFHLRLSGDPETSSSGHAGVGVALCQS